MPHYICTGGCKSVLDASGACQAPDCSKNSQPLMECDCADNQHAGALGEGAAPSGEETPSGGEAPAEGGMPPQQ